MRAAVETIIIPYFYDVFRAAWVEPDAKTREFAFAMQRTEWMQIRYPDRGLSLRDEGGIKRLPPPGEESPIEMAFHYLLNHHNRTRRCPNSECPAPYFFAARHTQRYCSEKCAQIGERETKRKWWAEHGTTGANEQNARQPARHIERPRRNQRRENSHGSKISKQTGRNLPARRSGWFLD